MNSLLITPDNALYYIHLLLALPLKAFQPRFQKMACTYQAELQKTFTAYQAAQHILLPSQQAASQTQWHRLNTLARKMNSFLSLLTEATLNALQQQEAIRQQKQL